VATKRMILKYSAVFLYKTMPSFSAKHFFFKRPKFWFLRIEEKKEKEKSMSTCIAKFHAKVFLLKVHNNLICQ
jgi:hypothetical protein